MFHRKCVRAVVLGRYAAGSAFAQDKAEIYKLMPNSALSG